MLASIQCMKLATLMTANVQLYFSLFSFCRMPRLRAFIPTPSPGLRSAVRTPSTHRQQQPPASRLDEELRMRWRVVFYVRCFISFEIYRSFYVCVLKCCRYHFFPSCCAVNVGLRSTSTSILCTPLITFEKCAFARCFGSNDRFLRKLRFQKFASC